ncbi:hypothetical protein ACFLQN_02015 [Candidatus Aenigmatarchaeota archaeon]
MPELNIKENKEDILSLDAITITYGGRKIPIPFNAVIGLVDNVASFFDQLQSRIEKLEKELKEMKKEDIRSIVDDLAEKEIISFIKNEKKKGKEKISILDIMESLCLPADQINRIMEKIKKRGIREID